MHFKCLCSIFNWRATLQFNFLFKGHLIWGQKQMFSKAPGVKASTIPYIWASVHQGTLYNLKRAQPWPWWPPWNLSPDEYNHDECKSKTKYSTSRIVLKSTLMQVLQGLGKIIFKSESIYKRHFLLSKALFLSWHIYREWLNRLKYRTTFWQCLSLKSMCNKLNLTHVLNICTLLFRDD